MNLDCFGNAEASRQPDFFDLNATGDCQLVMRPQEIVAKNRARESLVEDSSKLPTFSFGPVAVPQ